MRADATRVVALLAGCGLLLAPACRAAEPARDSSGAATASETTPSAADASVPRGTETARVAPRQSDGSWLLASLPAGAGATYDVVLAACGAAACPVRVRLREGGRTRDSALVEWESVVEPPRADETEAGVIGIGDPLATGQRVVTWTTGSEEDAVSTLARTMPLGTSPAGVLMHQSGGFEQVKRMHYLFVARDGRLAVAWRARDREGPTSSHVDTMTSDGAASPTLLVWRLGSEDGVVTTWELERLRWSAGALRATRVDDAAAPVLLAVARTFPDADAATRFLAANPRCSGRFLVMRAPAGAGVAIAMPTVRRALADSIARGVDECADPSLRVVPLGARRD